MKFISKMSKYVTGQSEKSKIYLANSTKNMNIMHIYYNDDYWLLVGSKAVHQKGFQMKNMISNI